jgi:Lamin Tail Domain
MQISTLRAARMGGLVASFAVAAAALVACADQPVGGRTSLEPGDGLQALECRAVVTGTPSVTCTPPTPTVGGASAVMYGGQNIYVTLTSTNLSYNAETEIFQFDATVQNLMNEAIGTPDGVTPATNGVMVFFYEDPSNGVTVSEPTGTAFFTSANQPYHAYLEVLDKDEVSSGKTWKFHVPDGVASFSFRVLIETEVQYKLVINEVMVNPAGLTTEDQASEWVELYNAGTRAVDLQNLVVADSAASGRRPFHPIASSVVVPSGGYVVLGGSTNTVTNKGVPVDYSWGGAINLATSLDAFKIARVVGSDTLTLDRTQHAQASTSAKDGVSRELKNPALDNSNMDGSNWDDASVTSVYGAGGRGTPKAQNSTYTP